MNKSTEKHTTYNKSFLAAAIIAITAAAGYIPFFVLLIIRSSRLVVEKTIHTSLLIGLSLSGAFILYRLILSAIAFFINTWRNSKTILLIADAGAFLFPFGVFLPYLLFSLDGFTRWVLFALLLTYGITGFVLYITLVGFFREYSLTTGYSIFFLIMPFLMQYCAEMPQYAWIWFFAGCISYILGMFYSQKKHQSIQYLLQISFTSAGIVLQTISLFMVLKV
ncbi:MAG TPA: hypothetical protein P5519_02430 [Spirochaetia bacterium]|nr:hypothetical protein [Spirochaetales bacterium]HRS64731.1 hypothetical protein [Spirochaetia bacterium]HPD80252.1 hypothetical protein [Spirochaetales bacterium]HQG40315.1 hypothetical protein [Spirochaetales bacterium]HQK34224.1 hypothetical protein [Spirochaetales bacterium]